MKLPYVVRAGVLALTLASAGCHLPRPGEVRAEPIAACAPTRLADLEARFAHLSDDDRELLNYCRNAQAAQAVSATQEHLDYIADLQFLGLVLGLVPALAIVIDAIS